MDTFLVWTCLLTGLKSVSVKSKHPYWSLTEEAIKIVLKFAGICSSVIEIWLLWSQQDPSFSDYKLHDPSHTFQDISVCSKIIDLSLKRKAKKTLVKQPHTNSYFLSVWFPEVQGSGSLALCGPNKVVDESTCECVCQNGLTEDSCDPGWKLDHDTCEEGF